MSDLRTGLRALITEYGRDGGNDDIEQVLDRAIALITQDGVLLSRDEAEVAYRWYIHLPIGVRAEEVALGRRLRDDVNAAL